MTCESYGNQDDVLTMQSRKPRSNAKHSHNCRDPEELFQEFMDRFERENHVPFIDIATRKGMGEGIAEAILIDWELKFGEVSEQYKQELQAIDDLDLLRQIFRAGKSAGTLEDLRQLWKPA
jgi:hypothetical protein